MAQDPITTGISVVTMFLLAPFVFAYVLGVMLCGFVAGQRGRTGVGWMLLALFATPLLALLALAALPNERRDLPKS